MTYKAAIHLMFDEPTAATRLQLSKSMYNNGTGVVNDFQHSSFNWVNRLNCYQPPSVTTGVKWAMAPFSDANKDAVPPYLSKKVPASWLVTTPRVEKGLIWY